MHADLAQLVEHIIRNDGVTGSSPVSGTTLVKLHPIADKAGHLSEMVSTAPAERQLDLLDNVAQMFSPRG